MGGEAGAREQKQQLFHDRSKERNLTENSEASTKAFLKRHFVPNLSVTIFFSYIKHLH